MGSLFLDEVFTISELKDFGMIVLVNALIFF